MWTLFVVAGVVMVGLSLVTVWSCCAIAGRGDERMSSAWRAQVMRDEPREAEE